MHMLMLVLPKAHRDTLEVLFVFLKWVASFAHLDERTVPEEFAGLSGDQAYFAGCVEMPGKEFMKKMKTSVRLKASGRQLGTMSPIVGGPPYAGGHPGRQGEPVDAKFVLSLPHPS